MAPEVEAFNVLDAERKWKREVRREVRRLV
jgi:hypothetical protein